MVHHPHVLPVGVPVASFNEIDDAKRDGTAAAVLGDEVSNCGGEPKEVGGLVVDIFGALMCSCSVAQTWIKKRKRFGELILPPLYKIYKREKEGPDAMSDFISPQ